MTTMQPTVMDRLELGGSIKDSEPSALKKFGHNVLGTIRSTGEAISRAQVRFEVAATSRLLTAREVQLGSDYGVFAPAIRDELIKQGHARTYFDARS